MSVAPRLPALAGFGVHGGPESGQGGLVWETYTSGHVVPQLDVDVDELYDALDESALT